MEALKANRFEESGVTFSRRFAHQQLHFPAVQLSLGIAYFLHKRYADGRATPARSAADAAARLPTKALLFPPVKRSRSSTDIWVATPKRDVTSSTSSTLVPPTSWVSVSLPKLPSKRRPDR